MCVARHSIRNRVKLSHGELHFYSFPKEIPRNVFVKLSNLSPRTCTLRFPFDCGTKGRRGTNRRVRSAKTQAGCEIASFSPLPPAPRGSSAFSKNIAGSLRIRSATPYASRYQLARTRAYGRESARTPLTRLIGTVVERARARERTGASEATRARTYARSRRIVRSLCVARTVTMTTGASATH